MLQSILNILYFFLPAIFANLTPVFVTRYNILPNLNRPLDSNLLWHGKRLLGDHKTWRGFLSGLFIGTLIGGWQGSLLLGFLLSFGALLGDATKSFFKRRLTKPAGSSWPPFDQIDFILGAIIFSLRLSPLSLLQNIFAVIILGLGSYFVSYLGVKLKLKKEI